MFCKGVDVYNLQETGDSAVSITTYVGHSMSTGPKAVVHKKGNPPDEKEVIGTLCALMYKKNCYQDNPFYIIEHKKKEQKMEENKNPVEILMQAIGEGKNVVEVLDITETILRIVSSGMITVDDAIGAINTLRGSIDNNNETNKEPVADEDSEEICIVRRLTPTETARLQGFPDDYTKIDGEDTADAPQFKSHGNSWATPCANFVSTRMEIELRRLGHEGTVNYATCCSGIEAHTVAVSNLNWKAKFFSEIEPFPCRVLAYHYPEVPNLGDLTQIHYDTEKGVITNETEKDYSLPKEFWQAPIKDISYKVGELDVFSGGTPCQSVSVAGKREGMAEGSGTRSSLAFHYQRVIDELKPTMTLWENVGGCLSSNGGADFVWFLNKCAESGYSLAWRVLDAQYTMTEEFPRAVPQRRRRIWLVGYRGNDWRVPARILFEKEKDLLEIVDKHYTEKDRDEDRPMTPARIPGLGFKSLNKDADIEGLRKSHEAKKDVPPSDGFLDLFSGNQDESNNALKVSRMIPLESMPAESDFSKLPLVSIYEFAREVGEPTYLGPVFRTDKKTADIVFKQLPEYKDDWEWQSSEEAHRLYSELKAKEESGELQWEGAEKISPSVLEDIGNAGIIANGRILTMACREWTSGIQLSPEKYLSWEVFAAHKDWLKANELLPEAYDETVCGLSDVLQDETDEKYNLSWRACFGILRRAETRGKELPPALYIALLSTIRENAGIVKWVAINGKTTKKKDTDLTEQESAKACFDKYISQVMRYDDIVPVQPKNKSDNTDSQFEDEDEEEAFYDEQIDKDDIEEREESYWGDDVKEFHKKRESIPDLPNGCINESGGETAPTIVASQYKGPGNTQDATIVAQKKEIPNGGQ